MVSEVYTAVRNLPAAATLRVPRRTESCNPHRHRTYPCQTWTRRISRCTLFSDFSGSERPVSFDNLQTWRRASMRKVGVPSRIMTTKSVRKQKGRIREPEWQRVCIEQRTALSGVLPAGMTQGARLIFDAYPPAVDAEWCDSHWYSRRARQQRHLPSTSTPTIPARSALRPAGREPRSSFEGNGSTA